MNQLSLPAKGKAIVFDLDGTLADGQARLHLLPKPQDAHQTFAWDAFNLAAVDDLPLQDNIDLCNLLGLTHRIIILTGRSAVAKDITLAWLDKHGVNYDNLIMRGQDDHRKDIEFKEAILNPIKDNILCAFDALEHVAKHLRGLGITCHLVTHYDTPKVHTSNDGIPYCEHTWSEFYDDKMRMGFSATCTKCGEVKTDPYTRGKLC